MTKAGEPTHGVAWALGVQVVPDLRYRRDLLRDHGFGCTTTIYVFFSLCAFGIWTIKFGNILIYLDSSRGVGRNRPLPTSCGLE